MKAEVGIIIANYNGRELLEENLPSVLEAARENNHVKEIIVIDDGSTDESVSFLKKKYCEVRVVEQGENKGFISAINTGVNNCHRDVVVLLNTDVKVEKNFLSPLIKHFMDERIFAVVPKGLIPQKNMANESVTLLRFEGGYIRFIQPAIENNQDFDRTCTVSHACGGYSAFNRQKFLQLGGLDRLYYPFYWEDADICFRAWKMGWFILYEPESIVYHQSHGTIKKVVNSAFIEFMNVRNMFLFTWKNITDENILVEHIKTVNRDLQTASVTYKIAFYEALKKLMYVLTKRKLHSGNYVWTDRKVLEVSSNKFYPEKVDGL